jgi:deferrochelatase/peroxidase EfeB
MSEVEPMEASANVTIDAGNVQGIIQHFYARSVSRHLLFRFASQDAGKRLLHSLLPLVTAASAGASPVDERLLNIGITASGLAALGVPGAVLDQFPLEFLEAPDSAVMGDFGDSAVQHWWSGKFATSEIHAVVHLFCNSVPTMEARTDEIRARVAGQGVEELIPTSDGQPITGVLSADHKLHFGYRDGLSQPDVAWADEPPNPDKINFRHFLLGYSTREVNSSPPMFASRQPEANMSRSLVKDGTYSVFRWIYQDVARFNRFLSSEGPKLSLPGQATPADPEELLAAKLLGRWRDGTPLLLSPDRPDPSLSTRNDFEYETADPDGKLCPFSAHIRVTNPRNQKLNQFEDPVPRVIRRGTPFGERLEGCNDDGQLRGLIGMFLCASIAGQFYKMTSWMKANNFSPKFANHVTDHDPFANGVPGASRDFRIATSNGSITVQLQDFTRTLGTALFLLPGLSALRQLAT